MTDVDIRTGIEEIMRNLFKAPELEIRDDLTADDVAKWDSLSHIQFMMTVEGKYNIRMKNSEVGRLKNVGDLISLVTKKMS